MKILTLTGPSCSGKTTLLNELVDKHGFASIVSHTTRTKRPREEAGKDYHFISQAFFDAAEKAGEFMETVNFNGFSYGVSVDEMAKATRDGKTAVLIVEPKGLKQIERYCVNHKIPLMSLYVSGKLEDLIVRYLVRMGPNGTSYESAYNHARRIESLFSEHNTWAAAHRYDRYIPEYNESTQEEVIRYIKESEFLK